jgi:glutamate racemase
VSEGAPVSGDGPLGIFDSGVGGLSVAREIHRALPTEDLLYVADTAYCPYGDRADEEVRRRTLLLGAYMQDLGAKLLVVACNTATGAALEPLRAALRVPVVGLEPAVKTAVARTKVKRVGVLATSGTVRSARLARLIREHADGVQVIAQPCPGLADRIEAGELEGPALEARLRELAGPLVRAGVDEVVLGCTHYPFVSDALAHVFGPGVELIESAPAIARRTQSLLAQGGLARPAGRGSFRLLTTGDPAKVRPVVERLWGGPVVVEALRL